MRVLLAVFFIAVSAHGLEISTALDAKLKAAQIPIDGVSIGKRSDKNTWRIDFKAEATALQKSQAAQIVAAFDPVADTVEPKTELQLARDELEKLKAQMKEVAKTIPSVETVQAPAAAGASVGTSK